jgi:hypothetical protein
VHRDAFFLHFIFDLVETKKMHSKVVLVYQDEQVLLPIFAQLFNQIFKYYF